MYMLPLRQTNRPPPARSHRTVSPGQKFLGVGSPSQQGVYIKGKKKVLNTKRGHLGPGGVTSQYEKAELHRRGSAF